MKNPSDTLTQYPQTKVRIRFEDCDPFGHLNNGRYMDYFLNAREDQLRDHYDLDIYAHMKQNSRAWVVSATQIAYLREIKFMEEVNIQTCLRWFTSNELMMEGQMLDVETGTIKAVVWMRFVYINARQGKRENHEPELGTLFNAVAVYEKKQETYFEDRVKELKAMAFTNHQV